MMSQLSILILASALGQVTAEPDLLNSIPPDADIVLRVQGITSAKNNFIVMLKAMSPALAASLDPSLEKEIAKAKALIGEQVADEPFFILFRGVPPQDPGSIPFAVMIKSSNYEAVLKSIAGGKNAGIKRLEPGYDSFNGPGDQTWYAAKKGDIVGFGSDKILIEGFSKTGDKAIGKVISPGLRKRFLAGDLGLYVNVNALTTRYKEPIAKAEQALFATFDTLGAQLGSGMTGVVKSIYGEMFDSIKEADLLAKSFEFGSEGLRISGVMTIKTGSKLIKGIANIETSEAVQLAKFPANSSYFVYMNVGSEIFRSFQSMSNQMMSVGGKPSTELEAAIAKERGRIESYGSTSIGDGMKTFQITTLSDPKSFAVAYELSVKVMGVADSPLNFFKEIVSTPNAETCRGFTFTRIDMTMDYDKLSKLQPNNPAVVSTMKAMYGGDKITTWLGVSDTQTIQMIAPSWADARSRIEGYYTNIDGIGTTPGFRSTRAKLPKEVSFLLLMSAQGFVRQLTAQFSALSPLALKQPPADLPKEPALIGFSLSPAAPNAFEFQLFVPSTVGPVFEKGLVPFFSHMQATAKP